MLDGLGITDEAYASSVEHFEYFGGRVVVSVTVLLARLQVTNAFC